MPRKARDVSAGLLGKGFRLREGDHKFFHRHVEGKKTVVFTKISQGEREIADGLLGQMAKQVRLSKRDFLGLVDCPLSEEQYVAMLRELGHVAGKTAGHVAKDRIDRGGEPDDQGDENEDNEGGGR